MNEFKVTILGKGGVGKTTFIIRFVSNMFIEEYDPTISDSYRKQIQVDKSFYLLELLDSFYEQEYPSITQQYIRSSDGIIIMYSVTDMKSFETEVEALYEQVLKVKDIDSFPMVLVGTKCDAEVDRQVPEETGKMFAKKIGIPFMEVSSKTGKNVDECIYTLVREMAKAHPPRPRPSKKKHCMVM